MSTMIYAFLVLLSAVSTTAMPTAFAKQLELFLKKAEKITKREMPWLKLDSVSEKAGAMCPQASSPQYADSGTCTFANAEAESDAREAMCSSALPAAAAACALFPADCTTNLPAGNVCAPTGTNFNPMVVGVITTLVDGDDAPPDLKNGDDWDIPCVKEVLGGYITCTA